MDNKTILFTANEAVSAGDYERFLAYFTENTVWEFVGDQTLHGKEAVRRYMKENYLQPPIFTADSTIQSGDFVTVTGQISLINHDGTYDHYEYCDNWRFENGKIAALKAYVIPQKPNTIASQADISIDNQVVEAVYQNDITTLTQLLEQHPSLANASTAQGLTALMVASGLGYEHVVDLLLDSNANVLAIDPKMGTSALHKAAQGGHLHIIKKLLNRGAFLNLQSPIIGNTALMDAILYGQEQAAQLLLDYNARIELQNNFQETALIIAKNLGMHSIIAAIEKRSDAITKHITAQQLIPAIKTGQVDQVKYLLSLGVDVNERIPLLGSYDDDFTPVGMAAREGKLEILKLLLEAGAAIPRFNGIMGATALHEAAYAGHPEVIHLLANHPGISKEALAIDAQGYYNGMTALHDAVWQNNLDAVKELVEAGANTALTSHTGLTPFQLAQLHGYTAIVRFLENIK